MCLLQEFNSLCAFLTLEKLEDHPDYQNWTVAQGRWNCSTLMVNLLSPLLTERNDHSPTTSEQLENGLIKTVAMSLAYQQALATDKPFDSNQTHQRAVLSSETGYIVPDGSAFVGGADISANLVLQSPVAFRRQFDEAFAVPQVARAVQNSPLGNNASAATHALGGSPQQHGLRTNDGLITVQQGQQSTAHYHASPPPRQQETAMHDVGAPLYAVAPQQHGSAAAPLYPPAQPYAQQSAAAGQNVFAFAPPGGSSYITVPDEVPQSTYPAQSYTNSAPAVAPQYAAPYAPPHATLSQPMRGQQDAQAPLSIEVADGTQIPTGFSAFPSGAAPVSAIYAPSSQQYAGFQAVPVSYGSFTPNEHSGIRSAAAGMPSGGGSTSQFANQHTSQFANQNPPINPILAGQPTRDNYGIGNMAPPSHPAAPSSVRSVNARPPLAWTVEDEQPTTAAATAGPSTARQEPASKVIHVASVPVSEAPPPAAFVVGEPEEVKVKPMPAALRRKMLADQEAAAAAEEERQRMQAENLAAERASSRGRSRSAPRGAAVGANNHANVSFTSQASAGPPSSSRPVSAVRTRGVLKNNDPVQGGGGGMPLENVVVMKERSGSANKAVRRSHDKVNTEPVARPPSAGSQTSAKRESARPPAAEDIKPPSDRSNAQPSATVPGTVYNNKNLNNDNSSFNNSPYVPHVLFESKCPLRCAAVLSAGPERTHLAVGSNAKSIYTLSYSNEAMRPRNLRPGQDATSMVQLEGELQAVHNGSVYCMDWHSNMGLLVSGSNDKALRISKYD